MCMCARVHTRCLTQAKDYFLSPNVTKFELLWLKQRWSGGCKPHFRITLTLRQLLYNCCGSDPLELALLKKCCSFPKWALNQRKYTAEGPPKAGVPKWKYHRPLQMDPSRDCYKEATFHCQHATCGLRQACALLCFVSTHCIILSF